MLNEYAVKPEPIIEHPVPEASSAQQSAPDTQVSGAKPTKSPNKVLLFGRIALAAIAVVCIAAGALLAIFKYIIPNIKSRKVELAFYLKDSRLYQYDATSDEYLTLGSEIDTCDVSDDGKIIYYTDYDCNFFVKQYGKDAVKIDSDLSNIKYYTKDFTTVYYQKDDTLYKYSIGKGFSLIASDIYSIINVYDSGEIYYLKSNADGLSISDFVIDDMREYDSQHPWSAVCPNRKDYASDKAYEAARDEWWEQYIDYGNYIYENYEYHSDIDCCHQIRYDIYYFYEPMALCYYDGSKETVITDSALDSYFYSYSDDTPVIAYRAYDVPDKGNILKISEIVKNYAIEVTMWDGSYFIDDTIYKNISSAYIAFGGKTTSLEEDLAVGFAISDDGDTLYYVDNISKRESVFEHAHGDLYKAKLSNGKIGKAELYDTGVYMHETACLGNSHIMYYKNCEGLEEHWGDLYIDKNLVENWVSVDFEPDDMFNAKTDEFVYYDEDYLGVYKNGQSVKITDDACFESFLDDGGILYEMNDDYYVYADGQSVPYEKNSEIGFYKKGSDLYYCKDGETKLIAKDIDLYINP